jgi:DNA-binding response OmpR family regulator
MTTRVLIVDDEEALTRMIKLNLERESAYEVYAVNEGVDAIPAIREFKPDIILLDIMMPGKSGDEIAEEMRDEPKLSAIPVIFLTALVTKDETDAKLSKIGNNIFLAKPVKTQELIAAIEKTLDESG